MAFDAGRYTRMETFMSEAGLVEGELPLDKLAIDVSAQ